MDKAQADAIAHAIMAPDLQVRDEVRRKKAIEAVSLARRRRVAWFALAGSAVGAAIAHFNDLPFTRGALFGGIAGSVLGWLVTRRAAA